MCKREPLKNVILGVVDDWIGQCNDDINHSLEQLLEPNVERNLREIYDRKIQLTRFRLAIGQGIHTGSKAYSREMLSEVVDFIFEMDASI
jgi:hypothetical protein